MAVLSGSHDILKAELISSRYGLISKSKVWLLIQKTFLLEHSVIPKVSLYVSCGYLVKFTFPIILLMWSLIPYGMVMIWCFPFYLATFLNYFIIHNTFRWFFVFSRCTILSPANDAWCSVVLVLYHLYHQPFPVYRCASVSTKLL